MLESLLNEVAGPQACDFIKKRLQHRCFPVNIVKFSRTSFFTEQLRWLLLETNSLYLLDTGRKLNVYKTFRRHPGRLLKVLYTSVYAMCLGNTETWFILYKSMDWFLYDNGLRHERVKMFTEFPKSNYPSGRYLMSAKAKLNSFKFCLNPSNS